MRRACRLVMEQLMLELQPALQGVLSRPWLAQEDTLPQLSPVLERHFELYRCVRPPCREVRAASIPLSIYLSIHPSIHRSIHLYMISYH